jgi:hypothetical protein
MLLSDHWGKDEGGAQWKIFCPLLDGMAPIAEELIKLIGKELEAKIISKEQLSRDGLNFNFLGLYKD